VIVPAHDLKRRTAARLTAIIIVFVAMLGGLNPVAEASWPNPAGPTLWPVVPSGSFQFHVQPAASGTEIPGAVAFRTEFGPLFDSAETLAGSILSTTTTESVDVFAYANPTLFQAATGARQIALTPHAAVVVDLQSFAILIDLPELLSMSTTQVEDAIRNAVTQVAVQQATAGAAPSAFAAGIALYVELPTSEYLARLASIVQSAAQQDTLLPWFDLNRPVAVTDQELALAECYAIVSFLIDRYDIPSLRMFLAELSHAATWQDAMRTAYATDAAAVEQQWQDDLPRWTTSGWRDNLIAAFDLEPARALLAQGQYVAAKAVLDPSLNLYRQLDDPTALAATQELMTQADIGIQAESLMIEIESALQAHDYPRASNLLDQAEIQYASLPTDQAPSSLLAAYRQLATDGITATAQLAEADKLASSWGKYPEARAAARDAGNTFARLGDEDNRRSAETVLHRLDSRQRRLVVLMGSLGVMTLVWLGLWLRARGPSDVKWV
jgi:hypothetical protein